MSSSLSFQNRSGSYKMERQDNIVMCTIKGAMGISMAKRYLDNLTNFAQQFNQQSWGFVACAPEYQGEAVGAEEHLVASYLMAIEHNCKSDAYCMTSPMAIAQLAKLRQQRNFSGTLFERVSTDMEQTTSLVKNELSAIVTHSLSCT